MNEMGSRRWNANFLMSDKQFAWTRFRSSLILRALHTHLNRATTGSGPNKEAICSMS
jgi:hypothetical protein